MAPEFESPVSDAELLAPAAKTPGRVRVCVVTGTRAEYGLLRPVMKAIGSHAGLELAVVVTGMHLVGREPTHREVQAEFRVAGVVMMQRSGPAKGTWLTGTHASRIEDAEALGRGVSGLARTFYRLNVDLVLVLGDRIEAFAAASAASVGGIPLAHVHGGDVAEGVADEAMRHAISKLAHIHFPATRASADRLLRLGEPQKRVFVVGSPAIDGLGAIAPMTDADAAALGDPAVVVLQHPCGLADDAERAWARAVGEAAEASGRRVLWMAPNHDAGREAVLEVLSATAERCGWSRRDHLPRDVFVALLKRLAARGGVLAGNSSSGLIEASALGVGVVNVGPRQAGRECVEAVRQVENPDAGRIRRAIDEASRSAQAAGRAHPFGDGLSGPRIAEVLAGVDLSDATLLRKRCTH